MSVWFLLKYPDIEGHPDVDVVWGEVWNTNFRKFPPGVRRGP